MVMPILLWIAFWSSMMGSATCLDEMPSSVGAETPVCAKTSVRAKATPKHD
jgi:hypothetical protein